MQVWAATTDARILVKSDNQVISPGAHVYIDSAPRMPNLTMLVICGDGNPVTAAATWRLSISFLQTVNQVVERKDFKIPAGGSYTMSAPGVNGSTVPFYGFLGAMAKSSGRTMVHPRGA